MVDLVSLDFVKDALHMAVRDGNGAALPHEDDALIAGYIESVTEAVLRHLRAPEDAFGWDEQSVPKAVRLAIVLGVKSLYEPEQPELLSGLGSSDLKNPIVSALCMMRKPTYA